MSSSADSSEIADAVTRDLKRYDRDRYLASLLAPSTHWPALWALLGFNLELAKTRESVSQPILGQIRLQWWRDAVDEIYAGKPPRQHLIVTPLAAAIARYGLTRTHLDRLIDARERDLDAAPPATLAELESYAEGTGARLFYLGLEVLRTAPGDAGFMAARAVGIAWALTGLIRAIPFHAATGRLFIPAEIAQQADLHEADFYANKSLPQLSRAVEPIAAAARKHLDLARTARAGVGRDLLPMLLLARIAEHYLRQLARAGHDPYAARVQQPDALASLRLLWGRAIGRF